MTLQTKSVLRSVAAGVVMSVAVAGSASAELSVDRLTIATGPAGLYYSQIATALTTIIQEKTGIAATARPHGGTSQYLPQLHRGEVLLGMNSGLDANAAYSGKDPYPHAMNNIRAVMVIGQANYSFLARRDSGIETVAALLAGFVFISGMVGYFFMPDTGGRSLEDLERDRSL